MRNAFARNSITTIAVSLALSSISLPRAAVSAQEVGAYVGGGVGGIRDVRRPIGGGIRAAMFIHDWLGVRVNAGHYWTVEHRKALECRPGVLEPICNTIQLSSHSHFPQLEALAVVRGHIPGKGIRVEFGVGPTWLNVTNEIQAERDSMYSPRLSSSAAGGMVFGGVLVHPPWSLPLEFEGAYAYHMTSAFGACTNQPNDPLCGQHLNFHELRASLVYRPRRTAP